MKVTMRPCAKSGRSTYLWEVLVNGLPIGGDRKEGYSLGRVLKMGRSYLPILDGRNAEQHGISWGQFSTRKDAAEYVAETATEQGYFSRMRTKDGRKGNVAAIAHGEALIAFDKVGSEWIPLTELEVI